MRRCGSSSSAGGSSSGGTSPRRRWPAGTTSRCCTGAGLFPAARHILAYRNGDLAALGNEACDAGFLLQRGIGHEDLPLWPAADEEAAVNRADPARAIDAVLTLRALAETIRDTLADAGPQPGRLSADREADRLSPAGAAERRHRYAGSPARRQASIAAPSAAGIALAARPTADTTSSTETAGSAPAAW